MEYMITRFCKIKLDLEYVEINELKDYPNTYFLLIIIILLTHSYKKRLEFFLYIFYCVNYNFLSSMVFLKFSTHSNIDIPFKHTTCHSYLHSFELLPL